MHYQSGCNFKVFCQVLSVGSAPYGVDVSVGIAT